MSMCTGRMLCRSFAHWSPLIGVIDPMNQSALLARLLPLCVVFFALVPLACSEQQNIPVFVHGLPAQQIQIEQENLGEIAPEEWRYLEARPDIDGVDTGGTPCTTQICHGVLVTLFIENPSEVPWAPPMVRVRRQMPPQRGLPIAFSGREISPKRIGRLRVLLHAPTDTPAISLHLSHSVSVDVSTSPAAGLPISP